MTVTHFEAFTAAKDPAAPETNEDRIVAIPGRLYAVVDGATDLGGIRHDDRLGRGASGGRLAAEAVAEALIRLGAAPFAALPAPHDLIAGLNAAIAAVYARLELAEADIASGRHRFRAAVSVAAISGGTMRLIALGDCPIRVNGRPVLDYAFPGDVVLSAARAAGWHLLAARGHDAATIRPLVRQMIVAGPASAPPLPAPFEPGDAEAICAEVRANRKVAESCGNDRALIDALLRVGLEGLRAEPETYGAVALDGCGDPAGHVRTTDLPLAGVRTLEIASDGYPAHPDEASVAAWERALAEVDATDPERIGTHASTKGRTRTTFGDDRSIVIASEGLSG